MLECGRYSPHHKQRDRSIMINKPSITIDFNPLTLDIDQIKFSAETTDEENRLREILAAGIRECREGHNAESQI